MRRLRVIEDEHAEVENDIRPKEREETRKSSRVRVLVVLISGA